MKVTIECCHVMTQEDASQEDFELGQVCSADVEIECSGPEEKPELKNDGTLCKYGCKYTDDEFKEMNERLDLTFFFDNE